jgi:Uma2 family endonuclease
MRDSATARRLYDWDDYQTWPDEQRWEIIEGEVYDMTPAPAPRHQRVLKRLCGLLDRYLEGKPCEVLPAPIDVKLSEEDIVLPDLIVVCSPEQIKRTHVEGAPTLVVEILSESTALHDRTRKLRLYARSGVREVWLVTPYPWLAEVLLLDGISYRLAGNYTRTDLLTSPTFPDLRMDLGTVFDFPLDPGEAMQMVREGHPPYAEN